MKTIGLDIGSTTLKCVVADENGKLLYNDYQRHNAKAAGLCGIMLRQIAALFPQDEMLAAFSCSA